MLGVQKV